MKAVHWLAVALLLGGCGGGDAKVVDSGTVDAGLVLDGAVDAGAVDADLAPVVARVTGTLTDLGALGSKRAGTAQAMQASQYVFDKFSALGLSDVHFETFQFPRFVLTSSSLAVTANGAPLAMPHDVLAYSGAGTADAEVVPVGIGQAGDYAGKNVTGKIVMVRRDTYFHRSAQYREVIAHGGAGMLYVSASPMNLIQIGTVADPEDGLGPIPTVTVGMMDGDRIAAAVTAGQTVRAVMTVQATLQAGTGRNVIARLPGSDAGGAHFLLGAHFDTWYEGAVDNTTGVAALLETARAAAARSGRQKTLVFVAYDAEELGLFGSYDYLRQHIVAARDPVLAVFNFEMPASHPTEQHALAYTLGSPLRDALMEQLLNRQYGAFVALGLVPSLFGGGIPTDIQGMYWYGLQGLTTFCSSIYYHTSQDTSEKVDTAFLALATQRFDAALARLDGATAASLQVPDTMTWKITTSSAAVVAGREVTVTVTNNQGTPQVDAQVRVWLDVDDFTRVALLTARTDASGIARVTIPSAALTMGSADRWIHATAGMTSPLAETMFALP